MTTNDYLEKLITEAEVLVKETQRCVEKGWERKSRLLEVEKYLAQLKTQRECGEKMKREEKT